MKLLVVTLAIKFMFWLRFPKHIPIYSIYYAERKNLNVYVQVRTKASKRILDIGAIQENIGSSVSDALPALHTFIGNDYTSAFFWNGKGEGFQGTEKL